MAISEAQRHYEHRCICDDDCNMSCSVVTNSTQVELQSAPRQSSLEPLKHRQFFELYIQRKRRGPLNLNLGYFIHMHACIRHQWNSSTTPPEIRKDQNAESNFKFLVTASGKAVRAWNPSTLIGTSQQYQGCEKTTELVIGHVMPIPWCSKVFCGHTRLTQLLYERLRCSSCLHSAMRVTQSVAQRYIDFTKVSPCLEILKWWVSFTQTIFGRCKVLIAVAARFV